MADVVMLIVGCPLRRKESRGLHYSLDYLEKHDKQLRDTVISLGDVAAR